MKWILLGSASRRNKSEWDSWDQAHLLCGWECTYGGRRALEPAIPLDRLSRGERPPSCVFEIQRLWSFTSWAIELKSPLRMMLTERFFWVHYVQPPASLEGQTLEDQAQQRVSLGKRMPVSPPSLPSQWVLRISHLEIPLCSLCTVLFWLLWVRQLEQYPQPLCLYLLSNLHVQCPGLQ